MGRIFFRQRYRPRFAGYALVYGLSEIIDGLLSVFAGFFGYGVSLHAAFCEWNLKRDVRRRKAGLPKT